MIDFQVFRSRRKTLTLQVKHGQVVVRAPLHVDHSYICSLVKKKAAWLEAKIFEQSQTINLSCDFTQGSTLFIFGKLITLDIQYANANKESGIMLAQDKGSINNKQKLNIILPARFEQKLLNPIQLAHVVKKQLESYFKQIAQDIILPKVEHFSALTQLVPKSIKIRQYKARWGSCNSRDELSFNYLLVMLPMEVIDYVVVHELCHLKHLNHSNAFWQLVAHYFPEYKKAKQWIKEHQSALHWNAPC